MKGPSLLLQSVFLLSLLFAMPQLAAQPSGGSKTVKDSLVAKPVLSPEPWESQYQQAFTKANTTSVRIQAFYQYFNAVYNAASFSQEDKLTLLGAKVKQMIEVDFYALHELRMQLAMESDLAKSRLFFGVLQKNTTAEQNKAFTDYLVYITQSSGASVYNQTNGTTTKLAKPTGWPNHLPLPGYGWGKTHSSDNVEVPVYTQYHLTEEERFAIIKKHLSEGKKVSPDDISWATKYEAKRPSVTGTPPVAKPVQPAINFSTLWAGIEGATILMNGDILFIPKGQKITDPKDMVELHKIRAAYTYSSYYAKNIFSSFADPKMPVYVAAEKLVAGWDRHILIVHEIKACSRCAGQGGSWNNQTRKGSTCSHCKGSGCQVSAIFNNGSVRAYFVP